MTEIEQLRAENEALHEVLEIISKNLTQTDGIDPEGWWLELTADEAAKIREIVEKNKVAPLPNQEARCKHGTLVNHCPDCAPDYGQIEANEKAEVERRKGFNSTLPPRG